MGLSKSKTTQTNAPSAYARPQIDAAGSALGSAFAQTQPQAQAIGSAIYSQLPGLQEKAFGTDPGIAAATGYNTDVLGGKYLDAQNPYLASQIAATNSNVTDRVNAAFGAAGRTGSGANTYTLGKALAGNESALRYSAYNDERSRMGQAAALAPSLNSSQYAGLGAYLQAAAAATGIPQQNAQAYASGLGSLFSPYNTQTGTQSQSLGSLLGGVAGAGLAGWASGGFKGF